jgi:hypothetical protein
MNKAQKQTTQENGNDNMMRKEKVEKLRSDESDDEE